ncbi:MAG TPA: SMP-30/gluconolactonase/LRE family protein [Bryobacteraceae bacterium]|nr:SMP-30/gluconolactonase/LRE family protein [Bryobacteraceae bacterium]
MKCNVGILFLCGAALSYAQGTGHIAKVAPALDQIVSSNAKIDKLGGGFGFVEGPVWIHAGYLLFSDIPNNVIRKWMPDGKLSVFREHSGFSGSAAPGGGLIGSNGLTLDKQGRLILCEHGNRRVELLDMKTGKVTVLADRYQGKRLNSPNDAVVKSDGSIYFTDPPYGLAKEDADPQKELKFNGVYRLSQGKLQLLYQDLSRPNGIAFSPDEKYLYVGNSDAAKKMWTRFEVQADGTIANGKLFFDVTRETADGLPDGLKVDSKGNVYCSGPGGVWIFSPAGKHLGTIQPPEVPANVAFGDADGKTLYMTARTGLYRVRLNVAGTRP